MYKSIVKSVKAGSYLGAVPGGGLTEEGRGSCALKGKKESGGSSLRGMNADTLEGNPRSLYFMQKGSFHLPPRSSCWRLSAQRADWSQHCHMVLREEPV